MTRYLLAILLTGCATTAPTRVVTTPAVCPAPRALPASALAAIDALPATLPELAIDGDPALNLLTNGAQSDALYQRALQAAHDLAEWMRKP